MNIINFYQWNVSGFSIDNPHIDTLENYLKRKNLSGNDDSEKKEAAKNQMETYLHDTEVQGSPNPLKFFIGTETEWTAFVLKTKLEAQMNDFLSKGGQVEISQLANDLFTLFKEDVTTDAQSKITVKVTGLDHTVETHDYTINQAFLEGLKHEVKNATTRIRVALGMVTKQHAGNYTSNAHLEAVVKAWHDKMIADPVLSSEITSIKTIFADAKLHSILDYYRTTSKEKSVEAHIKSLLVNQILK